MMTYHKHGMGEAITLNLEIIVNGQGKIGQTPVAVIKKHSTGEWLNDAKTAWQAGYNDIAMVEVDSVNLPGVYALDISHIDQTAETYDCYLKNTGTYAGVSFEAHQFTGAVYIPPSSSYSTGTVIGMLDQMRNKDANRTFDQATDSLEALKDAGVGVDLTPVLNAIAALQADLGDPSVDATTIYAKIQALQAAVVAIPVVNILSATKGAIQVSYAKTGGTVEVVKGDTISIPYGPLGKDITGRKVYFAAKQILGGATYSIAIKEITAQIINAATFTGTIPLTSAELNLTAGNYYAEIESRASDGTSTPATELKFTLKVVDQVITPAA